MCAYVDQKTHFHGPYLANTHKTNTNPNAFSMLNSQHSSIYYNIILFIFSLFMSEEQNHFDTFFSAYSEAGGFDDDDDDDEQVLQHKR